MRWSNEQYDGKQKSYGFEYDGMNRLNDAFYKEKTASTWNVNNGHFDAYNISYDKNGNIETLMRKDNNTIVDNLGYTYINSGNQLKAVNDVTTNTFGFNDKEEGTTEYIYDDNGNMTRDCNKEIQSISYNMLNLPEVITFEGTGKNITYYYDAAGIKWRKKVTDGASIIETDYVGSMILEEDQLKLIHTAEGRIAVDEVGGVNDYKYQYALKDHLGNNRVTFGATEKEYLATMESELSQEEEAQFSKIAEYREQNFMYNRTTSGEFTPNESIMLNSYKSVGGQRRIAGAMKGLKIQPNDVVNMEVWAKHASTCGASETSITTFLFSALTAGFGITSTGETQQAYNALSSLLGAKTLINQTACDVPAAYLNYIFFDENYTYKWSGISQVTSAANGSFEQLSLTFNAGTNSGYLYIYASNESNLDVDVYFDDMKITHSSNLSIVNAEDYYPFGLTFNSYQDADEQDQDFKYNGKEWEDDLGLNLVATDFRMYDPSLGRFNSADALADYLTGISPYGYAYNNPILFNDPTGLMDTLPEGIIVRANRINSSNTNFWTYRSYSFNPVYRSLKMRYEKGDYDWVRRALNDKSLSYGEGLGYETDFWKGVKGTYAAFSMYTGGLIMAAVASPVLLENLSGSLSLNSGFGGALGNMGKEFAIQEAGNLATGQSWKNIDVADIAIAGLPAVNLLQPITAGMLDYNPLINNNIKIGFYHKSWGNTLLDIGVGVGTNRLNKYIDKSGIDESVVKVISEYNNISKGLTHSFSKKALNKNSK